MSFCGNRFPRRKRLFVHRIADASAVMNQDDSSTENSYKAEVTCRRSNIALVRNPTDPNSTEFKLALGIESPSHNTKSAGRVSSEQDKRPQLRETRPPPLVHIPRPVRPACVPSTVARCFCTVDILYD